MKLETIQLLSVFSPLPIQNFLAPQLPSFLMHLYFMLPTLLTFVSKLKFFWHGWACTQDGMVPRMGLSPGLLGHRVLDNCPSYLLVEMWPHALSQEGVLPGAGVYITLAWEA